MRKMARTWTILLGEVCNIDSEGKHALSCFFFFDSIGIIHVLIVVVTSYIDCFLSTFLSACQIATMSSRNRLVHEFILAG